MRSTAVQYRVAPATGGRRWARVPLAVTASIALAIGVTGCASAADAGGPAEPAVASPTVEASAPTEEFAPFLEHALPDIEAPTFTAATVTFPPGAVAAPHRHGEAFVFAYVVSGTVESRIDDEAPVTYEAGDSWIEEPGAHHVLTKNVSKTDEAQLLVAFVAPDGAALKVDDASH